jgi:perosamine synthetase
MEAALGIAQLEEREENQTARSRAAASLTEGLGGIDALQLPGARPGSEHAFMFYPLVVRDPGVSRDRLVAFLEERGIETRYLLPLINQPVYQRLFGNLDQSYPVAARLNRTAFYVGCHPGMAPNDLDFMIDSIHSFFQDQ